VNEAEVRSDNQGEVMRVMALQSSFILLDEPSTGVEPIAVEDYQRIVETLKTRNVGVRIADYKAHETLEIADRAYVISAGEILIQGASKRIVNDDLARNVFPGQQFRPRGIG
jgi:lipopolysaccharide export system ATP-binding protein